MTSDVMVDARPRRVPRNRPHGSRRRATLRHMNPELLNEPLLTEADVDARVDLLVGEATTDRRLWLLLVDGDRRQTPVVMPIDDVPRRPDPDALNLARVLVGVRDMIATPSGVGAAVFALERVGPGTEGPDDIAWADALTRACAEAEVGLDGVFLSTRDGVRRLRAAVRP